MEFVGFSIGVVSLFQSCITTYQLFSTSSDLAKAFGTLHCKLIIEEARLRVWGRSWGISSDFKATPQLKTQVKNVGLEVWIEKILSNIKTVLADGRILESRYGLSGDGLSLTDTTLSTKPKSRRPSLSVIGKIRWAITDKDAFRTLVADLKDFNDGLYSLLPLNTSGSLHQAVTCELLLAIDASRWQMGDETSEEYSRLRSLLDMRKIQADTETSTKLWERYKDLEIKNCEEFYLDLPRDTRGLRAMATFYPRRRHQKPAVDVVIEWKTYSGDDYRSRELAADRAQRVAQLMHKTTKSLDLRVLDCAGYFHDVSNSRYGLLYNLPSPSGNGLEKKHNITTISLHDIMLQKSSKKPSLEDRFQLAKTLARSMIEFHSFNWLHKSFSSNNIVFFRGLESNNPSGYDIRLPYVAGFGLSRPDYSFLISEKMIESESYFLVPYQHPEYHQSQPNSLTRPRYHRVYDIYALGCVLLEVGLWRTLNSLKWKDEFKRDLYQWQEWLLETMTPELGPRCGSSYQNVVKKCLTCGYKGEELEDEQLREIWWAIVGELEKLRV